MKFLPIVVATLVSTFLAIIPSHADTEDYTGTATIIHDEDCDPSGSNRSLFSVETYASELTTTGDGQRYKSFPLTLDFSGDELDFDNCTYSLSIDAGSTGGLLTQARLNNSTNITVNTDSIEANLTLWWDPEHASYRQAGVTTATIALVLTSLSDVTSP